MLTTKFFDRPAVTVARDLLGKVLFARNRGLWLAAMIIETEAYLKEEKASHASLGYTAKRKALFMAPGTIYMYYARGGDSLNVSCQGDGNAVLIKSGIPYPKAPDYALMIKRMQELNPAKNGIAPRPAERLCSGQTILCRSLGIKVSDWDGKQFDQQRFYIKDVGYTPEKIIQTRRLGIPRGRDEHLPYRFIDYRYARYCTKNPITRKARKGIDYLILTENSER